MMYYYMMYYYRDVFLEKLDCSTYKLSSLSKKIIDISIDILSIPLPLTFSITQESKYNGYRYD